MNVSLSKVVALTALSFGAQALSYGQDFLDFRLPYHYTNSMSSKVVRIEMENIKRHNVLKFVPDSDMANSGGCHLAEEFVIRYDKDYRPENIQLITALAMEATKYQDLLLKAYGHCYAARRYFYLDKSVRISHSDWGY